MNDAMIDAALATMNDAESHHDRLVAVKFAAIGRRVGQHAPELDGDADLAASHARCQMAEMAYLRACGE